MTTQKQYILFNYLEGTISVGQLDPDWPERLPIKEYAGEDQAALDAYEHRESLKLLARMSEGNTQPPIDIHNLRRADGTPFVIDITPK